jgi:hypothetical protein
MSDTPDDAMPKRKIIEITEPIAGLDELYEDDRALYVHSTAEGFLGMAGRMISFSKSNYIE